MKTKEDLNWIGKIKIKNPQRMIEFKKLNDYVNWTSKWARPLYENYCNNLSDIIKKIKEDTEDIEIEFSISQRRSK